MEYLDFELPIKELEEQLEKCQIIGHESSVDVSATCEQITQKLEDTKRNIYGNLTAWQRVQLSRHPNRPYTMDYIRSHINTRVIKTNFLMDSFFALRSFRIFPGKSVPCSSSRIYTDF